MLYSIAQFFEHACMPGQLRSAGQPGDTSKNTDCGPCAGAVGFCYNRPRLQLHNYGAL